MRRSGKERLRRKTWLGCIGEVIRNYVDSRWRGLSRPASWFPHRVPWPRPLPDPDVEDTARAARLRLGAVSTQAVHDVLRVFEEAGLARRIEPAGSPARYENRVGDNHHHLVCRRCGAVVDVDCVVGHARCLEPAGDAGFLVDEADVTFWGICPNCQGPSSPEPPTSPLPCATRAGLPSSSTPGRAMTISSATTPRSSRCHRRWGGHRGTVACAKLPSPATREVADA